MRNVSDKSCGQNQNKHLLIITFFFENRVVYEKCGTILHRRAGHRRQCARMRLACWIPKATNTKSEDVVLLFRCNNGCM